MGFKQKTIHRRRHRELPISILNDVLYGSNESSQSKNSYSQRKKK